MNGEHKCKYYYKNYKSINVNFSINKIEINNRIIKITL